ncbi:uncharacterized protein A4U43_C03F28320 [Asparagus officinalis]|uniref:Secreted protein n=1 Tax=Asparagus officinalis TaxID=4686 RepID=A0A5P1FEE1_ASPOF|nr:uncharacterized protein A4U43_C03F28320 [Asparagus officinalis]
MPRSLNLFVIWLQDTILATFTTRHHTLPRSASNPPPLHAPASLAMLCSLHTRCQVPVRHAPDEPSIGATKQPCLSHVPIDMPPIMRRPNQQSLLPLNGQQQRLIVGSDVASPSDDNRLNWHTSD